MLNLYDDIIRKWDGLINDHPSTSLNVVKNKNEIGWSDDEKSQMILRSDMAYELGGSSTSFYALGGALVTEDESLISQDEIILIGDDLKDITKDTSYARISFVLVDSTSFEKGMNELSSKEAGNRLYNAVKSIDYVRYHFHPEGFMMRVSSVYGRESVRISKEALKNGLSFEKIGNLMNQKFHQNQSIKAVKTIFITDPGFDYKALSESLKQAGNITGAIDHIMKNTMTDCSSCSLQAVCDEVEDLRKLHFSE